MINTKFYSSFRECTEDKVPLTKRGKAIYDPRWKNVLGVLRSPYMLFDIDDKGVNANLFLELKQEFGFKCHIVESCNGIHAIFKTPTDTKGTFVCGTGKETITGIICDYKNSGENERIIADGKPHKVIEWCDDVDELPFLLFPFARVRNLQDEQHGSERHRTHGDLNNIYATYTNDVDLIMRITKWVNDTVFKEPRKSINWSRRDVLNSIEYVNSLKGKSLQDVLTEYNVPQSALINYIVRYGKND